MISNARVRSDIRGPVRSPYLCLALSRAKCEVTTRTQSLAVRAGTIALILGWTLCAAVPAHSQAAESGERDGGSAMSAAQIEALVETLRDDVEREKLVLQLEALLAAQSAEAEDAPAPGSTGVGATALSLLARKVEALNTLASEVVHHLAAMPAHTARFAQAASDREVRASWLDTALVLLLIVGIAFGAEWLVIRFFTRPRTPPVEDDDEGVAQRAVRLIQRTLIDLAPVGAFALCGYAALAVAGDSAEARVIALVIINANVIVRAVSVLARIVLRPRYSMFRFIDLSDENANYAFFWVRRLTVISVYGFFSVEALPLLGIGAAAHAFTQKLVGLFIASMFIVLVLQNRRAVHTWISPSDSTRAGQRIRRALAEVWHLVAIGYVVAVYLVWAIEAPGGFEFLLHATVVTLVTALVAVAALAGLDKGVERAFRLNEETRQRFPRLEERVSRYRGRMESAARFVVIAAAALVVVDAWGLGPFDWLGSEAGRALVGRLVTVVAVAALALVAWEMLGTLVERYLEERDEQGELVERGARIRTFLPLVRNVVRIVLLVLVTLVVLSELGVDIGPLLAGAGIVGLAVSFGAQSLVKDVITGFFILLEDTISVGDVVELGGRAGVVESMSIRSIRMRDLRGHVHTVPFGEVATVLNMTKDYSYAFIEAGVAYRENVDDVVEVLRAIGDEMQADEEFGAAILEPLEVLGLDSFGASSVNIRVRLKTVPMKQWAVRREFQRRMKRAFDERGIEIPFPHQTVYFGADKSGRAPSARIALERESRGDAAEASATPPEYSDSEFERLASLGAESGQPIRPERK